MRNAIADGCKAMVRAIGRSNAGSVLPMAAGGMLVTAALVGGGVDMSRTYKVQSRLQAACDAGVLAGRRAVTTNGFDTAAQATAQSYFNVNFDQTQQGSHNTTFETSSTNAGNIISGTATTQVDMLVMKIFGMETIAVNADCQSTMGVGNSDVTMVLDTTGSMAGTRITALRTAMKNFYSTVATATQGSNARIRYAFVPYSTTVNVGRLLPAAYLANQTNIQSRVPKFVTQTRQVFVGWNDAVLSDATNYGNVTNSSTARYTSTKYTTSNKCTAAMPVATGWTNNGASSQSTSTTVDSSGRQVVTVTTSQPQIMTNYTCASSGGSYYVYYYYSYRTFYSYQYQTSTPIYRTEEYQAFSHWEYRQVTYDTSLFKTFAAVNAPMGSNGTNVSYTWNGCIQERKTVATDTFAYSAVSESITPSEAIDLNIDSAPVASDEDTKWAPLWPQVTYYRTASSGSSSPADVAVSNSGVSLSSSSNSPCPYQSTTLATMTQTAFNAYADALTPNGNTYHDIGMLWGARVSSPDGIFSSIVTQEPANAGNVSRHLIFMTDGEPQANYLVNHAYGVEYHDRRITADGYSDLDNRHEARFRALCDAVKAKGIRVWMIAFGTSMTTDLQYCASPSSAYTAASSEALNAAFQDIARQVGELRVLQ